MVRSTCYMLLVNGFALPASAAMPCLKRLWRHTQKAGAVMAWRYAQTRASYVSPAGGYRWRTAR